MEHKRRRALLALTLSCVFLIAACGSDTNDSSDTNTTSSGSDDANSSSSGSSGDFSKLPNGSSSSGGDTCEGGTLISILQGTVTDPDGNPIQDARPQPCVRIPSGELLCLRPNPTGADGVFLQSVAFDAQCMVELTMRVVLPGSTDATTYCEIPLPSEDTASLNFDDPLVIFGTTPAATLPPLGTETSARAVVFDSGLELDVTPDQVEYSTGGYDDLSSVAVDPTSNGLCFLDAADTSAGLFAFYPEANITGAGFPVRVPNTAGLSAGAEVELFVLGGLDCRDAAGETVPEGTWHMFGTGTVSADGTTITSDNGLPCLTWMRYAPK